MPAVDTPFLHLGPSRLGFFSEKWQGQDDEDVHACYSAKTPGNFTNGQMLCVDVIKWLVTEMLEDLENVFIERV